ncbi:MAG: hypothetical protein ABEJ70_06510 [Halobacteriaceae archaeon]
MGTPGAGGASDADRALRLLAHADRRTVLRAVAERPAADLSLDALAARVAREGERSESDRDAVRVALHHRHLPMLDEAGLVAYDHRANVVRCGSPACVEALLSLVSTVPGDPGTADGPPTVDRDDAEG